MTTRNYQAGAWTAVTKMAALYPEAAIATARDLELNTDYCDPYDWTEICKIFGGQEALLSQLNAQEWIDPKPVKNFVVWNPSFISNIATIDMDMEVETYDGLKKYEAEKHASFSSTVTTTDIEEVVTAVMNETNATILYHEI